MSDAIEEAAKLLGVDAGELRKVKAQKDRAEVKEIFLEALGEFFAGGDDDDEDDDDAAGKLADQVAAAREGRKTSPPKKKPEGKTEPEPEPQPASLAARLGLTGS